MPTTLHFVSILIAVQAYTDLTIFSNTNLIQYKFSWATSIWCTYCQPYYTTRHKGVLQHRSHSPLLHTLEIKRRSYNFFRKTAKNGSKSRDERQESWLALLQPSQFAPFYKEGGSDGALTKHTLHTPA